jgi:hypothetical protein
MGSSSTVQEQAQATVNATSNSGVPASVSGGVQAASMSTGSHGGAESISAIEADVLPTRVAVPSEIKSRGLNLGSSAAGKALSAHYTSGRWAETGAAKKTAHAKLSSRTRSVTGTAMSSARVSLADASKTAKSDREGTQSGTATVDNAASYTDDFADSTKNNAEISPPDPGTASPLDWTTGFDFGFQDFSAQTFLDPTIYVGSRSSAPHGDQQHDRQADQQGLNTSLRKHKARLAAGKAPATRDPYASLSPLREHTLDSNPR